MPAHPPLGRLVGRPLFWVATLALLVAVPLLRSVLGDLPPPPPHLGRIALPDPTLAGRPVVAGDATQLAALGALHHRLARLGDHFAILVVGDAPLPPDRSPRIWHRAAATPAFTAALAGQLLLVDAGGELRGRFDARDPAARDALVDAVARLVNDY